ncbi:MAG: signal peptidase I [Lachnospiraceae bacterium]|jgi:signal peptidase I|nr:signal peptidase I [Lachnospiraceae bacterium]
MARKNQEPAEAPKIPSIDLLREELAREEGKHQVRKTLINITGVLIVAAAVAALMATRLFLLIRVHGNSMAPTLENGEVILLHQTKQVEAGDIIGFYYGGRILLKRAIGCAGDEIEIDGEGNVYVNGEKIDEPYLAGQKQGKCELDFPYRVPEGMTFVLGDNRAISIDSRIKAIGCVEESQIVGKVAFRAWPVARMGFMR